MEGHGESQRVMEGGYEGSQRVVTEGCGGLPKGQTGTDGADECRGGRQAWGCGGVTGMEGEDWHGGDREAEGADMH